MPRATLPTALTAPTAPNTAPVHTAPVHTAPVHTAPVHTAPVHTAPPSAPFAAPFGAGRGRARDLPHNRAQPILLDSAKFPLPTD
ncbi:hypothetical protein EGT86_14465 [Burkholderia pseudomallei]|nr:hypothetical protein EGT86_14465 [Burkholderia pseudomallei]